MAERHERLYNQPSLNLTWMTQTVRDVSRAIDFLINERGVDARRIGLVGMSRGAVNAAIAAGVDRRASPVLLFYGGHMDALETSHLAAACPANTSAGSRRGLS